MNDYDVHDDAGGQPLGFNPTVSKVFIEDGETIQEIFTKAGSIATQEDLADAIEGLILGYKYGDSQQVLEMQHYPSTTRGANGEAARMVLAAQIGAYLKAIPGGEGEGKRRGFFRRKRKESSDLPTAS